MLSCPFAVGLSTYPYTKQEPKKEVAILENFPYSPTEAVATLQKEEAFLVTSNKSIKSL